MANTSDDYFLTYHKNEILKILEDTNSNKRFSLSINFVELYEYNGTIGDSVLNFPETSFNKLEDSIANVQEKLISEGGPLLTHKFIEARVYGLPGCPELHPPKFPTHKDLGKFLQIAGVVLRVTDARLLEFQKVYICTKCKHPVMSFAEYEQYYKMIVPIKCKNPDPCTGTRFTFTTSSDRSCFRDYQEIKIQEHSAKLGVGVIPNTMWVTLENDLVDKCKPGDHVSISGIVKQRWPSVIVGQKPKITIIFKAQHINNNNKDQVMYSVSADMMHHFEAFWNKYKVNPLMGRDIILSSFCPQIHGLQTVKLALAAVLAGGSSHLQSETKTRSDSHILLVGDPGIGKSQLLQFACKVIPRSVFTTGIGSTSAGLTAAAMKENGEWQLEGGALVLANGGICCIDEFNSMRAHDRTSIHEAMEQQTISVAKASIVCKLSTKCSVIAATNPKGHLNPSEPLTMNIGLASPLLSRFDIILLLQDKMEENWDSTVSHHLMSTSVQEQDSTVINTDLWGIEKLKAYFIFIKTIHPLLTPESTAILQNYYELQRRSGCRDKSRTTVRLLNSLIRLSQAHARLMFHSDVLVMDAVMAVLLVEYSMQENSIITVNMSDLLLPAPVDPSKAYAELIKTVLTTLELPDILENELKLIQNNYNDCSY